MINTWKRARRPIPHAGVAATYTLPHFKQMNFARVLESRTTSFPLWVLHIGLPLPRRLALRLLFTAHFQWGAYALLLLRKKHLHRTGYYVSISLATAFYPSFTVPTNSSNIRPSIRLSCFSRTNDANDLFFPSASITHNSNYTSWRFICLVARGLILLFDVFLHCRSRCDKVKTPIEWWRLC